MKIGILTFHRALNYGALLQTYALQHVLSGLGAEAQIIDYRNPVIEEAYRYKTFFERNGIRQKAKWLIQGRTERQWRRQFEEFSKNNLSLTSECYTDSECLAKISDAFDFYITGSDQVWNFKAHGFDKNYFLEFVARPEKRISYAASFGVSFIPEQYHNRYAELLRGLAIRSVREEEGKEIIEKVFGLDARMDLDPTLLLTKDQWLEITGTAITKKGRYILLYCFELTGTMKSFAEKLAAETGLEVIYFGNAVRNPLKAKCTGINVDPFEFIRYFINAEYVVTNSFHGTAFSINLNKTFFIELLATASDVNSRLKSIIRLTGLESRFIQKDKPFSDYVMDRIHWERVNPILDKGRKGSLDFLKKIIYVQ